jgi:hypothetical protein
MGSSRDCRSLGCLFLGCLSLNGGPMSVLPDLLGARILGSKCSDNTEPGMSYSISDVHHGTKSLNP